MTHNRNVQDDYISEQIKARSRPAVTKTRFLDYRSQYPTGLIIAVEGDDDKIVYSYWIEKVSPELRYEFFVCGGKRGVRQLRNSMNSDKSGLNYDILFLVDRDFDELKGFKSKKNVFMLDQYSIENYLVRPDVIGATLRVAFPGNSNPESRKRICDLFELDYQNFLALARPVNQRIFVARRLEIEIDDVMPKSLSKLAHVDINNVHSCGVSPESVLPFPIEPAESLVSPLVDEFALLEPKSRYRGKFSYKFLQTWLDLLIHEFKQPRLDLFPVRENIDNRVKQQELGLGALASRASLPCGFADFFANFSSTECS